jgi:VIT1/CCC1 family predicted Fe2+/Mn2+ transporter
MSVIDKNDSARDGSADLNDGDQPTPAIRKEKRLLNPVDRISEILFGLIMALTFTCTISIATAGRAEVKEMLIGAIGCNLAWGLVDALMFILSELAERGHGRTILSFVRKTNDNEKAREFIADALPPVISSAMNAENLDSIRKGLLSLPESSLSVRVTAQDLKRALGIFLLVFVSTIPVALPFKFIDDVQKALRVSNCIAIALMFVSGWLLAQYGGYNKWLMGFIMVLVGIALVALTIALGG